GANGRLTPGTSGRRARCWRPPGSSPYSWRSRSTRWPRRYAAGGRTTRLVLNPSPPAPLPGEVLAACDPLVVNEHEARYVLGEEAGEGPHDWAPALLALGPRSVVITLGAAGALVADSRTGSLDHLVSPKVEAVDTTGAGDAFTAALAWRLGRGDDLREAAAFAVRVGAAAVTARGAQESFPTLEEVDAL
ncbi:ribokinase, partial [Streptomyces sp. Ncost-T6T-2b]